MAVSLGLTFLPRSNMFRIKVFSCSVNLLAMLFLMAELGFAPPPLGNCTDISFIKEISSCVELEMFALCALRHLSLTACYLCYHITF